MVEAGLTPMQVIVAATGSAAQFLRAKDLGTLEAGKWADLVVLDRNPIQDDPEQPFHSRRVYRGEPGALRRFA